MKNLNRALPALKDKITQVEALSRKAPPSANMTESIRRIKEVIEETRNYLNGVKYFFLNGCVLPASFDLNCYNPYISTNGWIKYYLYMASS